LARTILILLAASAALGGGLIAALPPAAGRSLSDGTPLTSSGPGATVAGAFHVHSDRSDGSQSIDDIAAAAHEAGLQFLVFTDHGDGTAPGQPAAYRHGVLTIEGVEISTMNGHYAVVGMAKSPFPLAGEARDVVADVARLGGFGVVAHGDSPRSELQWTDWAAPVDGIEWLSLDTAWRRTPVLSLVRAFTTYWFRPSETLGTLLSVSGELVNRFDTITTTRPLVSLASTDAHGPFIPSYHACFGTMTTRVALDAPLSGAPLRDEAALVDALRRGRHFTVLDALANPSEFEFAASVAGADLRAGQGGSLPAGRNVILEARATGAEDSEIVLRRNGEIVRRARAAAMIYQADDRPAAYRLEVFVPHSSTPWIASNPIYVGLPTPPASPPPIAPATTTTDAVGDPRAWVLGHDPASTAALEPASGRPGAVVFRYNLGPGPALNQSASVATKVPPDLARYDRLIIEASAAAPMRVEIQLVRDDGGIWSRWRRSVYLDREPRTVTVSFDEMRPADPATGAPPLASIQALVFLVDSNNTQPGTKGEIVFNRVAYQR
jgi:hypothetical protein